MRRLRSNCDTAIAVSLVGTGLRRYDKIWDDERGGYVGVNGNTTERKRAQCSTHSDFPAPGAASETNVSIDVTYSPRPVRAACSRAKSSPAWWLERVSGDAETNKNPLVMAMRS